MFFANLQLLSKRAHAKEGKKLKLYIYRTRYIQKTSKPTKTTRHIRKALKAFLF